ncbi:hypothetical protein GS464_16310 [Rhodococcus hoagii]|nr:hypothetical protein [Prescottella equi]
MITATGGEGGGAVDSVNGQTGEVELDADDIDDSSTTHKFASSSELSKLAGIATGATANDTDSNLKNRANHTGTQAISTVTGLQTALDGKETKTQFNVKDYGALGDGTTDDTDSIQDALDAAESAGGGEVYFPAGTYKVSHVFAGVGVSIQGAGNDCTTVKRIDMATDNSGYSVGQSIFTALAPHLYTGSISATSRQTGISLVSR